MRKIAGCLAALSIAYSLAACGQSQATTRPTKSPTAVLGAFTLSDSGCGYDGKDTVPAGGGTIALSNALTTEARFDFFLLSQGHGYSELVAHVQEEERRRLAGEEGLGHPTFATLISSTTVSAHANQSLSVPGAAGIYGMACIPWNAGPLRMYAAGPLTVS